MVERRVEIRPSWPFRLPRMLGRDATMVRRAGVLHRLIHVGDEPVVVRAAQPSRDRVVIGAQGAAEDVCEEAIGRMRFALGADEDLRPFYDRYRDDPLIGHSVRRRPWLRGFRRPEPFEALAWAITEQLIDYPRAAEIQRRIVIRLGRRCERTGLRDLPSAATLAAQARSWSPDQRSMRPAATSRAARRSARARDAPRSHD